MEAFFQKNIFNHNKNQQPRCSKCGSKLDDDSIYCKKCGAKVDIQDDNRSAASDNQTERQTIYDGRIYKCPNCGEVLDAFEATCPLCGYELRDSHATSSVRELAEKIESILARQMPIKEEKSFMKKVFGKDFKNQYDHAEAQEQFENEKRQEIASLIINFAVPNTKEDIIEFMIMASSNIEMDQASKDDDIIISAWIAKLEQVYKRAKIILKDQPEFSQIQSMYDAKQADLKRKKIFKYSIPVIGVLMIIIGAFLGSASGNPDSPFYLVSILGMFPLIYFVSSFIKSGRS